MRNIKSIKQFKSYFANDLSLLCALDGYSQCTGGMTGTTLVCPNDVKSYTVNKTCQQIVWELPAGGTINSITNGGKTANITWGTDRGNFTPTADLVQCSPSSGPNAYCIVHVIKPTPPTSFTPNNISVVAQSVFISVAGGLDVTYYEWEVKTFTNPWLPLSATNVSIYQWYFNYWQGGSVHNTINVTTDGNTVMQFRVRSVNTACTPTLYSAYFYFTPQRP